MQVRQQTLDIAALIRITRQSFSEAPPRFVLLMEDDFVICERGLEAIQYAIDKVSDRACTGCSLSLAVMLLLLFLRPFLFQCIRWRCGIILA